jgi:hypothetical protein
MKAPILFLVGLAACTPTITLAPEASHVVTTKNQTLVTNCKLLGTVKGWSGIAYSNPGLWRSEEPALNDVKNQTSKLGGNTAWIAKTVTDSVTPGGTSIDAEAYRCA